MIKKLKTLCRGYTLLVILKGRKLLERFKKKELRKTNQRDFRVEKKKERKKKKKEKEKAINYMLNGKAMIVLLIGGLIKKI